jgi:prepilin-type processing-associated H-X9-DG protein
VSYDFALGVGANDPTSTTPLIWTRGLSTDGTWGIDTPWKRGGHIAYLDGHVQFYDELDADEDGALTNPTNGTTTTSIEDVINTTAGSEKQILRASGS